MTNIRKCSSLKPGEQVVFNITGEFGPFESTLDGHVDFVMQERRKVSVHYLAGYRDRHSDIPYENMLAVYNPDGEVMHFKGVVGPSDKLIAE